MRILWEIAQPLADGGSVCIFKFCSILFSNASREETTHLNQCEPALHSVKLEQYSKRVLCISLNASEHTYTALLTNNGGHYGAKANVHIWT